MLKIDTMNASKQHLKSIQTPLFQAIIIAFGLNPQISKGSDDQAYEAAYYEALHLQNSPSNKPILEFKISESTSHELINIPQSCLGLPHKYLSKNVYDYDGREIRYQRKTLNFYYNPYTQMSQATQCASDLGEFLNLSQKIKQNITCETTKGYD